MSNESLTKSMTGGSAETGENVLEVKNLVVHYVLKKETVEAVNDVSFTLKSGRSLGLVGETGAGKTTTALAIMNLVPNPPGVIKSGTVNVCGHEMLKLKPIELAKIRGADISMIFQDPMTSLNPVMTVGNQIAESVKLHEDCSHSQAFDRAVEMLELVGIPGARASEYPHEFSGGMQQRVVIAIALACNPRVLIADEPTTALDVTIQAQVLGMMSELKTKMNTALLMITHDLGVVAKMCDEVAVMYAGRIVEKGTLEDVFNNTMHPYTEGLFNSLPKIDNRDTELKPIPGLMADPTKLPVGCSFAPRCSYATDACRARRPEDRYVSDTHMVVCTAYEDPAFHIEGWQ